MNRANVPAVRVTVDGRDITPLLTARIPGTDRRRLVSLSLVEKRGDEADGLDLVIDDSDGGLALPRDGARIAVAIGWHSGIGVDVGLVDKGSFVVEDVEHAGPPDLVTVRARAADFTSEIRTRRERSWHATTLGEIVTAVARGNGLVPRIAPALARLAVRSLAQSREGDIAFLRRLGRAYDAVATVKDGHLVFAPVGAAATASGRALPATVIHRRDGDRHAWRRSKPEEAGTVEAGWHDRAAGTRRVERHGTGGKTHRLSRTYPTAEAARTAARTEHTRAARAPVKLNLSLSLGRADLYPEQHIIVRGFKAEIDAQPWLIAEARHDIGESGYATKLILETKLHS